MRISFPGIHVNDILIEFGLRLLRTTESLSIAQAEPNFCPKAI